MARAARRMHGIAAAPGTAIAPVWRYSQTRVVAPASLHRDHAGIDRRLAALHSARDEASGHLHELAIRLRELGLADEAGILEAQCLIALDPGLVEEAEKRIREGEDAATAVAAAAEAVARTIVELNDPYISARAADVRDVGARIVRALTGDLPELPMVPSIAVAEDLPPSLAMDIPAGLLAGIALGAGSRTSHAAILARAMSIPAVVAIAGLQEAVEIASVELGGELLKAAIDGDAGELILDPGPADQVRYHSPRPHAARRRPAPSGPLPPAALASGERIEVTANINSVGDLARALQAGAEGVGLFRTEFLFMARPSPPSETEQVAAYREALAAFGPARHVVIRLADIGGDKEVEYLPLSGRGGRLSDLRGIRLAYASPDLLLAQLRAIWRAGGLARVTPHVAAPMVATVEDVELLLALRDEARHAVIREGGACAERMTTGIMVEIPSAAILAPELARKVDFFSLGTNDLTQYTLAADRRSAALASLQGTLHPAVLRLVAGAVSGAHAAGIPVAVCGELAADPAGALTLAALGVDELSADPAFLAGIRAALASVTRGELDQLREVALANPAAAPIQRLSGVLAGRSDG